LSDPILMQKLLQLAGGLVKVDQPPMRVQESSSTMIRSHPHSTTSGSSFMVSKQNSFDYSERKGKSTMACLYDKDLESQLKGNKLNQELEDTSEQVKRHLQATQQLHHQLKSNANEIEDLKLERTQLMKRWESIEGKKL
jgi:septal ring factor EnvC (AmiA/AmiB activator)